MTNLIPSNEIPPNYLERSSIEPVGLRQNYVKAKVFNEFWASLTTKIYITLVLIVAITGFLTMIFPRPFWYPLIIFVTPFLGAYVLARSWPRKDT